MRSYVLITGAGGGLGKAFAAECAARGWRLLLTDTSSAALEPLAVGLERLYDAEVVRLVGDLTDPESRRRLWETVDRRGLRLHMLINNAGTDFEGAFAERRVELLRTVLRLNVEGTLEMTRRGLERRDPTRPLRIINVSSLAAFYPMPLKATYAASKRFVLDLSLALRCEFDPRDVTVTVLCPAGLPTNPITVGSIHAQGIWGQLTTLNVGPVAATTIDRALAGRSVYVPGAFNQALHRVGSLFPAETTAAFIGRRWRSVRSQDAAGVARHAVPLSDVRQGAQSS
jgi:short-subunit dehydrogenase